MEVIFILVALGLLVYFLWYSVFSGIYSVFEWIGDNHLLVGAVVVCVVFVIGTVGCYAYRAGGYSKKEPGRYQIFGGTLIVILGGGNFLLYLFYAFKMIFGLIKEEMESLSIALDLIFLLPNLFFSAINIVIRLLQFATVLFVGCVGPFLLYMALTHVPKKGWNKMIVILWDIATSLLCMAAGYGCLYLISLTNWLDLDASRIHWLSRTFVEG